MRPLSDIATSCSRAARRAGAGTQLPRLSSIPAAAQRPRLQPGEAMRLLTRADFEKLLEFRVAFRSFHRWSEDQAHAAGLTHVRHQLLVAVRGHPGKEPPTVGELAGCLLLRPSSMVELVDRAEAGGLVVRIADRQDGRLVRVRLTSEGDRLLRKLTQAHLDRLHDLAAVLDGLVTRQGDAGLGDHRTSAWRLPRHAREARPRRVRVRAGWASDCLGCATTSLPCRRFDTFLGSP